MPVYAKQVSTKDPRFSGRSIGVASVGGRPFLEDIPVPDNVVLCNGCNFNIAEDTEEGVGYLVYLSKRELDNDRPYEFYCYRCTQRHFPKAVYV